MTGAPPIETVPSDLKTMYELQCFLSHEAELLDSWRLRDWLALLAEDCRYLVPATDAVGSDTPERTVFIIADTYPQIVGRVERLESELALVERPRSRTRRLITNIRGHETSPGEFRVDSNFAVYRYRRGVADVFTGTYRHVLVRSPDGALRIRERRAVLDCEELRPQGKVSFVL